jgi:hypothetical protein
MACLPLFWRMMQCLGRYSATKHVEVRAHTFHPAAANNITSLDALYDTFARAHTRTRTRTHDTHLCGLV